MEGKSYHFPTLNVTIETLPEQALKVLPLHCTMSAREYCGQTTDDVVPMSKVFEFLPSGLHTQNNMMMVLPLIPRHSYDYANLVLIYQKDASSPFVRADSLETNKPAWMFVRDKCYIFSNHFCLYMVGQIKSGDSVVDSLFLEAMLFSKYQEDILFLKLTFGCSNNDSKCSQKAVTEVYSLCYCD